MNTQTILMCVVALILGMLLANMLKNVCGCKVVEGQGDQIIDRQNNQIGDRGRLSYDQQGDMRGDPAIEDHDERRDPPGPRVRGVRGVESEPPVPPVRGDVSESEQQEFQTCLRVLKAEDGPNPTNLSTEDCLGGKRAATCTDCIDLEGPVRAKSGGIPVEDAVDICFSPNVRARGNQQQMTYGVNFPEVALDSDGLSMRWIIACSEFYNNTNFRYVESGRGDRGQQFLRFLPAAGERPDPCYMAPSSPECGLNLWPR